MGLSSSASSLAGSWAVMSWSFSGVPVVFWSLYLSFLGAGGDILSEGVASLSGVTGAGWVSWPVVAWLLWLGN